MKSQWHCIELHYVCFLVVSSISILHIHLQGRGLHSSLCEVQWTMVCRKAAAVRVLPSNQMEDGNMWYGKCYLITFDCIICRWRITVLWIAVNMWWSLSPSPLQDCLIVRSVLKESTAISSMCSGIPHESSSRPTRTSICPQTGRAISPAGSPSGHGHKGATAQTDGHGDAQ